MKGFVCRANTFDNVKGSFPIGFLIWDLENKKEITKVKCDVLNNESNFEAEKIFFPVKKGNVINDWLRNFYDKTDIIGYLRFVGPDFQGNAGVYFTSKPKDSDIKESRITTISKNNLIIFSIYFTVRKVIPATWLNDRDQFLSPKVLYTKKIKEKVINETFKKGYYVEKEVPVYAYENDTEFQNDCLAYTLFNTNIQSKHGANHWIPYSAQSLQAAKAPDEFESDFMYKFVKNREFSGEAKLALDIGREIYRYYFEKLYAEDTKNPSYYDIREKFCGRNEKGTLNSKSNDETFNALRSKLTEALKALAKKIEPKVYEYGFLRN